MEGENSSLRALVDSLEKQLKEHGLDPVHPPRASSAYATDNVSSPPVEQPTSSWGSLQQPTQGDSSSSKASRLTDFRAGCIGDNYLGVSSGNSWLSPIEGTSLSLFGATLDLADFVPEDNPESGTSYQNFLDHAFVEKRQNAPQLPQYDQAKLYGEWYFRSIQPMLPILHKPHFMQLLHRVYNEGYQPTPAELVMVHMVMSMVTFQYNTRNTQLPTRVENFQHWHFSLSLVPCLIKGHTLPDMQGLSLICAQLRAFPRPGACWMFTNTVLGLAIELGLHRSVNAWQGSTAQQDPHDIELRKRIFWSLMLMHVPVSGKLGRPMPLRLEDFDIEVPEEAHDNLPEESQQDEWRKCSFRAGKWNFVLLKVQMKVYSTIYSISSSTNSKYEVNVRLLEAELKDIVAQFPPELSGGPETKEEDRVCALYLQLQATGCQLLIHHPALCRSMSPQVVSDNIDACLDASNRMLSIAIQLKALNSLDSTLYWNMDFLASMFTMLFAYHERRDRLSATDLQRLRLSMQAWLDVMGAVGTLLGSGDRLHTTLRNLVEWSIGNLKQHLQQHQKPAVMAGATSTPPTGEKSQPQSQQQTPVYESGQNYTPSYTNGANQEMSTAHPSHQVTSQPTPPQQTPQQPPREQQVSGTGYPNAQAYSYANAQVPYASAGAHSYTAQAYGSEDAKPNIEAQLAAQAALAQQQTHAASQPAASNYMPVYQNPTPGYPVMDPVGPMAWRSFAENMVTGMHTSAPGMSDGSLTSYAGMMPDPLSATAPHNGPPIYPTGATFGQMQMPPQDGSNGDVPSWPLIQY